MNENMNENAKVKFYLDKNGFFAESAMILLVLAAIFRVIGCWTLWSDRARFVVLLLLPVCCCLLMVLCIALFGKKGFFLSFIPVLLGMVFFICSAFDYGDWAYTVPIVLLCFAVCVVYTATVFGLIHTKWLLVPLFCLPLLYRLIRNDIPALLNTAKPVIFVDGMKEMSVLFMLGAMLCVSLGLKKSFKEKRVKAEAKAKEKAPAPETPAPVSPAPAPETPAAPVSTEIHTAPSEPVVQENPYLSGEPYTPVLTLDPEPVEPETADKEDADESGNE